ncbi:MAG TPA: tRNA preQ1(34) S-adenosylmethionine ribosyltransferase-isomerase QueA [Gaiellales bacterium]
MRTAELDYDLPPELIAQQPAEPRSSARLLVYDRSTREIRHRVFADLLDELGPDDLVVVNDTRVLHARIRARRTTGGAVELLLLEPNGDDSWDALARPARRLRAGETLDASGTPIRIDEVLQEGHVTVTLEGAKPGSTLERIGEMPVPPYIHRPLERAEDYQTVYAREPASAAAPTAGLHFTAEMWEELRRRFEVVEVTLAVGLDTFRPVTAEDLADHALHTEAYEVGEAAARAIDAARAAGRRIVAVGTTSVRVLETVWGSVPAAPLSGRASLFITPGYAFAATGAMVTNFHLPRSTLIAMVMAFAGTDEVRRLYRVAVEERYRFYSFGDAMLIL